MANYRASLGRPVRTAPQAMTWRPGRPWFTARPRVRGLAASGLFIATFAAVLLSPAVKAPRAGGAIGQQAATGAAGQDSGDAYRLSPMDVVRIQVFEWRPSKDEVFEWKALNRQYKIGPTGLVTLPFVGSISVVGKTPSELAAQIADRLRATLDLAVLPDTTVEMVAFRPLHVTGDVEKTGEIAFTPGMTVLQAVSLGGGIRQDKESAGKIAREMITTSGQLDLLLREQAMLVARKARLDAELSSANSIVFKPNIARVRIGSNSRYVVAFMEQEQRAFDGRRRANATQIKALSELKLQLDKEVESLAKQAAVQDTQIELLQREFDDLKALATRRLATRPRVLAMQRNMAQLEGDRLRIQAALSRGRQEAKRAAISMIELQNTRTNEINREMQLTTFRLESVSEQASTIERLLVETSTGGTQLASNDEGTSADVKYTIVRPIGGQVVALDATEATRMEAGDILKVKVLRRNSLMPMMPGRRLDIGVPSPDGAMAPGGPAQPSMLDRRASIESFEAPLQKH